MKVELNIDAGNLGETVVETFNALTKGDKKKLAKEMVEKWLTEPIHAERGAYELKVIDDLRQNEKDYKDRRKWNDSASDEEIRKSYEFRDKIGNYRSTRDIMVGEISDQAQHFIKNEIANQIKESSEMQYILEETLAEIKANFKSFVHDAMIAWFCQGMSQMTQGIQSALFQSNQNEEVTRRIAEKLNVSPY